MGREGTVIFVDQSVEEASRRQSSDNSPGDDPLQSLWFTQELKDLNLDGHPQ